MRTPTQAGLRAGVFIVLTTACSLSAWAQIPPMREHDGNALRDSHEWSFFAGPDAVSERKGPVQEHLFQSLKQGGPWVPEPVGQLGPVERKFMSLLQAASWKEAKAYLKNESPDLNLANEAGDTPLTLAIRAGQIELMRDMLRKGADIEQAGAGGYTPLALAAVSGQELLLKDLLRQGARTDRFSRHGQLPLHLACLTGKTRAVQALLDAGADPAAYNRAGRHALAEAATNGQTAVMALLLARGVPIELRDQHKLTALHAAAAAQNPEGVAWLREHGAVVPGPLTQLLLDQLAEGGGGEAH